MLRLILMGAPGSGKGTQAALLVEQFGILHISTGETLREAIDHRTDLGGLVEPYMAIGRLVLASREHIIALEPLKNGLMGTLLRYPYEVRSEDEYFDDIQDVKVTKDMLDLAQHIVQQKTADFDPL